MRIGKKEKYLDAIYKLVLEHGFNKLLMEEIAERIGVTKMTLYNNFKTKTELFKALISYRSNKFIEFLNGMDSKDMNAIDELLTVLAFQRDYPFPELPTYYKSFLQSNPRIFNLHKARFRRILKIFIVNNINRGVEQGLYLDTIDADNIANFSINTMDNMMDKWLATNMTLDLNTTHEHIIIYHIRGIASPKGTEYLSSNLNK